MRKIILPPVVLLFCVVCIIVSDIFLPGSHSLKQVWISGTLNKFGFIIIALGVFLPVWGAIIFKQVETNLIPYKSPDKMVTKGPFAFTRNPMYLGMLLVLIGMALIYGTYGALLFPALYFAVANWWFIPFEEGKMAAVFGDAFTDYKNKVRRWI